MPKQTKVRKYADDAPLTSEELRTARPLHKVDPKLIKAIKQSRGRPVGRTKESVHISLDADIIASLRKGGKGWQTRLNDMLRATLNMLE